MPVACGGVLVMPGDIVVADDDGAVVVPTALAARLIEAASEHAEWEEFSRVRLSQGGDLRVYYPLTEARGRNMRPGARAPQGEGVTGSRANICKFVERYTGGLWYGMESGWKAAGKWLCHFLTSA